MTFEVDPPDEPCPDCGSTHHRSCSSREVAMSLLRFLCVVEGWAQVHDPRAQPYFDANAIRWEDQVGGRLAFHPQRFDAVRKSQEGVPE